MAVVETMTKGTYYTYIGDNARDCGARWSPGNCLETLLQSNAAKFLVLAGSSIGRVVRRQQAPTTTDADGIEGQGHNGELRSGHSVI